MSMIPDETIEQVRDSADLVGLIGESVDLRRTGADYRGPCPFHGGVKRNFSVSPKRGRFYCFVCHESGDVFTFFMKRLGMDYPSAVREVAQRCGITIPETARRLGPDPREPLYSAASVAQDWFTRQLVDSPEAELARSYLKERDVDLDAAASFSLGYAPRRREFLDAMAELGVSISTLVDAGLVQRRDDGEIVPRFRGRLLFPIHDQRGRVVGFGGRILGGGEPKYLNSPETEIFRKGRMLYNLHQAKNAIRKEQMAILVEGYFDVLRLVLAGVEQVVAPLGTALTPDQAALLKRYAPLAVLLYDSDQPGLRAAFRAADELLRHEMRVRIATLPPGEDPDTLVRKGGAAALTPIVTDALDVIERKIQLLERRGWFDDLEHRREALDRLLPTIRAAKESITRELYLSRVAERTGVSKEVLAEEVAALAPYLTPRVPQNPDAEAAASHSSEQPPSLERHAANDERDLLRVLISSGELLARAPGEVPVEWFEGAAYREVYEALLRMPPPFSATQLLEQLSPEAQTVGEGLFLGARELAGQDVIPIYEGARQALAARPLIRELVNLDARIREAAADDQVELLRQKSRLAKELERCYPQATERFRWQRRRRRARPQGPRP